MSRDAIPFEVLIDERVEKDLEKIPKYIVKKFIKLLDEFEKDPIRPRSGFDLKPMEGYPMNNLSKCLRIIEIILIVKLNIVFFF